MCEEAWILTAAPVINQSTLLFFFFGEMLMHIPFLWDASRTINLWKWIILL